MSFIKYLFEGRHFAAPKHLRARLAFIDKLSRSKPPPPWHSIATVTIGGLECVGFDEASDTLLVISSTGAGVFDCQSGDRIAREETSNVDVIKLTAEGIGPIAGKSIRISGLHGGGLPTSTADGWGIERYAPSWPDEDLILSQPGETMLWTKAAQQPSLIKLGGFASEIRTFGFSPTGRSLVVATGADLAIFGRD